MAKTTESIMTTPRTSDIATANRPLLFLAFSFLAILLTLYRETAWSAVAIWVRSETFAHSFLIVPIVAWMIWTRRSELKVTPARPATPGFLALFLSGFLWLAAYLVDVLIIQQYALVLMIISGLWTILGTRYCFAIAFPLAYLLFLVPVGEGLIPWMMEYTATFTVAMVKLSGIPVYREGLYFHLPSGSWSVVEACSGVRYLIASATLGCLYAYLTYRTIWKRIVFIIISIIVPIFANGLRAYIIVMLGHWSGMKIATGVDHLIYGWIFFGVVMFILFAIGNIWREDQPPSKQENSNDFAEDNSRYISLSNQKKIYLTFVFSVVLIAVSPLLAYKIEHRPLPQAAPIDLPAEIDTWLQSDALAIWQPESPNISNNLLAGYQQADHKVGVYIYQFLQQTQGNELVPGHYVLAQPKNDIWRVLEQSSFRPAGNDFHVNTAILSNRFDEKLLVWWWYRISENYTSNKYRAKILEAIEKLTFGRQDSARIFIATTFEGQNSREQAMLRLTDFLENALPEISKSLNSSVGIENDQP